MIKHKLEGVPETLLITVRARAVETIRKKPLIKDQFAVDILNKLQLEESSKNKVSASSQIGVVIRTYMIDNVVSDFVNRNPEGVIVCLGCGLDARYERLNLPNVCWYDIDLPESIEIRSEFFQEKNKYKMIAKSMLDYSWMDSVPKDKPVLILAEGVFMYFTEEQLKLLFAEIAKTFMLVEMVFDSVCKFIANRSKLHPEVKKYNAFFNWGIDSLDELKQWDKRISIISVEYMMNYHFLRWPLKMHIIGLIPKFRKCGKIIHLKYNTI